MQHEGTHGRVNLYLCSQGHFLQRALKRCVAHSGGEHQVLFKRRTGDRKSTRVSLRVSFWRIGECQVGRLPRFEIEPRWFLEIEGHGAFRNLDSVRQFALVTSYRNFVSSHAHFLNFWWMPTLDVKRQPTLRQACGRL